jgi:hypothetical protein
MEQIRMRITGLSPLLMHADTLANPMAAVTTEHRELTAKRKKSFADHVAIARSEFLAGLYWSSETGVYIPGQNLDASFLAGAKLQKLGTHWKRGCLVIENKVRLLYSGPRSPETLWEDQAFRDVRGVRVGTAKVMRVRPIFLDWQAELTLAINEEILDLHEARRAVNDAGALIGVCEYRPRFGRFKVDYV